eukprot:3404086-Prymnesium_polylepis.1
MWHTRLSNVADLPEYDTHIPQHAHSYPNMAYSPNKAHVARAARAPPKVVPPDPNMACHP